MTPRHGLVIGKFYPPHAGHHLLVRAAAERCRELTVVVMGADVESLPRLARAAWLEEVHAHEPNVTVTSIVDNHPVDLESDAIWEAHVALMRTAASGVNPAPIDVVFTSEHYGEELARRLGAAHVAIDVARAAEPISGTAVRADLPGHWEMLAPCVRAYLALRVVLVGAESTGKTTLAENLAARLRLRGKALSRTEWVAEVGRETSEQKLRALGDHASFEEVVWTTPDFVSIAAAQRTREASAAREGGPVIVCDTDAFATGVWHERYLHRRSAEVEANGDAAPYHLYLLTHPDDVPFVQDGLRTDDGVRHSMTQTFADRLDERGLHWRWIRGARREREDAAIDAIDAWLEAGWRFADPLG